MENIISVVAENFKKNAIAFFQNNPSISDIEQFSAKEIRKAMRELTAAYAQLLDKSIVEAKAERKSAGLKIVRRNDTRRILTGFGDVAYQRSYYQLKDGTYGYPVDAALGVSSYQRISESVGTKAVTAALTDSFSKAAMISANG